MPNRDACAIRYLGEKRSDRALHDLVGAIGTDDFAANLLTALNVHCPVDFCMAYGFDGDDLTPTLAVSSDRSGILSRQVDLYTAGGLWRRDQNLNIALNWTGAPRLAHVDPTDLSNSDLHDRLYSQHGVIDRIIISDGKAEPTVISLLRTWRTGAFAAKDLQALETVGGMILSTISSHRQFVQASSARALTSLENIHATITACGSGLSDREAQVCARVVWGLTSPGIAIDLGISVETATTYRKRAYHRLGISTQRELLMWYLKQTTPRASAASSKTQRHLTVAARTH